ncbi:MAG: glycoside hydrolase family 65 protein [Spirochaetes bacterium]|nr:glycoside hydrolase family 65 protein [Spirochaetota bacterium]
MISHYDDLLSPKSWLITRRGWAFDRLNHRETIFALGNGYIASRGILEELPKGSIPGTFFAGIYDITGAQVTELVNAPNPFNFKIIVDGEKVDVMAMDVSDHVRVLDMKQGFLVRGSRFTNRHRHRFDYQSIRFTSQNNRHVAVMQIYFTSLDADYEITLESEIDTSITNRGLITEGKKKHFHIYEVTKKGSINYLCVKTLEKEYLLGYASYLKIKKGKTSWSPHHRTYKILLKKGETCQITKYFSFFTSKDVSSRMIKSRCLSTIRKAIGDGFDILRQRHSAAWLKKWKACNIEIEGDAPLEKGLRFNVYHMLIAVNKDVKDVSIGAKSVTGEGYRGHIFWDTEIFLLPFYIYTQPVIAKNLLMYRYNRLNQARSNAALRGYKGAMFPWESADSGKEETPSWYKDENGEIKRVTTGDFEHHITSDVAYAVYYYFIMTQDFEFMLKQGLEILFETARFWESRMVWNKKKDRLEIRHVTGPDEYHDDVHNNAFTNLMARWNLQTAYKVFRIFNKAFPEELDKITGKIKLTKKETDGWRKKIPKVYIPYSKKENVLEEFEGYFRKKRLRVVRYDKHNFPIPPRNILDLEKTQFSKQPDVIMVLYLLGNKFDIKFKKSNFEFYEKRTLHGSSLSPSLFAVAASEIGETEKAYRFLTTSINLDLKDIYRNTHEGIHAANLGGSWQAVINGFAGVRAKEEYLLINPHLPLKWKKIQFCIKWCNYSLAIKVYKNKVDISFPSGKKGDFIPIKVYRIVEKVYANKKNIFYKQEG